MSEQISDRCRRVVDGQPCPSVPVPGDDLCAQHGGKLNRLVRRQAKLHAAQLIEPAIAQVARLMTTAKSESVRLRAAQTALDLNGLGGTASLRLDRDEAKAELFARLMQLKAQQELAASTAAAASDADGDLDDDDVEDAEEVPDAPELEHAEPVAKPTQLDSKRAEVLARLESLRAAGRLNPAD